MVVWYLYPEHVGQDRKIPKLNYKLALIAKEKWVVMKGSIALDISLANRKHIDHTQYHKSKNFIS